MSALKMKVLRIAMDGEEHPFYTFTNAFDIAFNCDTIWWQKLQALKGNDVLNNEIIEAVTKNKYDAVFMQIQQEGVISERAAIAIKENSIGFNWTGDVRNNIDWYIKLGKYFVTCFTNQTDVDKMRAAGHHAEYLQIGYDHMYYFPERRTSHNNIVFCANYYPHNDYPLTPLRRELVYALKKEFGDRFNLYGGNWKECGIHAEFEHVNNIQEAEIYKTCAIAINCSHFDYSRYSSDRLFREMACGAFALSHNYKDYEMDFTEGEHLVTWDSIDDLIKKCHYYLEHKEERQEIAANGCNLVTGTAMWRNRLLEFTQLVNKYKSLNF